MSKKEEDQPGSLSKSPKVQESPPKDSETEHTVRGPSERSHTCSPFLLPEPTLDPPPLLYAAYQAMARPFLRPSSSPLCVPISARSHSPSSGVKGLSQPQ